MTAAPMPLAGESPKYSQLESHGRERRPQAGSRVRGSFRDTQVGDVFDHVLHSNIVVLDACHCYTGVSTMRNSVAKSNNTIDCVLVLVNKVTL